MWNRVSATGRGKLKIELVWLEGPNPHTVNVRKKGGGGGISRSRRRHYTVNKNYFVHIKRFSCINKNKWPVSEQQCPKMDTVNSRHIHSSCDTG